MIGHAYVREAQTAEVFEANDVASLCLQGTAVGGGVATGVATGLDSDEDERIALRDGVGCGYGIAAGRSFCVSYFLPCWGGHGVHLCFSLWVCLRGLPGLSPHMLDCKERFFLVLNLPVSCRDTDLLSLIERGPVKPNCLASGRAT